MDMISKKPKKGESRQVFNAEHANTCECEAGQASSLVFAADSYVMHICNSNPVTHSLKSPHSTQYLCQPVTHISGRRG